MKKILSIVVIALMMTGSAHADDISAEQALQIASQFAKSETVAKARAYRAPTAQSAPTLAHSMKSRVSAGKDNVYVINLGNDQGFVIVSGEDGADSEVLGYCDHGSFNYADAPVQFLDLLNNYSHGIDSLRKNPAMAAYKSMRSPARASSANDIYSSHFGDIVVGPLLKTKWNQTSPYNNLIENQHYTGCVPTAVAQVMNYWKWPKQSKGQILVDHTSAGEEVYEDFPVHTYDWDNMLDEYGPGASWEQINAVAQLMADLGKAMGTKYGQENGSPTPWQPYALIENFGYEPGIENVYGNTALDVMATLTEELDNSRPVLYAGHPEGEGDGHALVCDGYTKNNFFHFNYGWGGNSDGYYRLTSVKYYRHKVDVWKNVRPYDAVRKEINGIEYGLKADGTAEILRYKEGGYEVKHKVLTIPDYVTDEETGKEYAVTRIVRLAFYMSGSFKKVVLGNNIKTIDPNTFIYSSIDSLVLSDKMEVVPEQAFRVTSIKHLTIGENVRSIGRDAFYACPLTEIVCKSKRVELEERAFAQTKPNQGDWEKSIVRIGKKAFYGTTVPWGTYFENLEVLGDSATYGGSWSGIFAIGPKVREIAPSALDGLYNTKGSPMLSVDSLNPYFADHGDITPVIYNKNKTSVIIALKAPIDWPETVVKMEPGSVRRSVDIPRTIVDMEGAFRDCPAPKYEIARLTCPLPVPPVVSDATFSDAMFSDEIKKYYLEVPPGTEELYAEAPGWHKFKFLNPIYDYESQYGPLPPQDLNYQMVVYGDTLKTTIETGKVNTISMSENENGEAMVTMSLNGRDDITVKAAAIDSIIFKPGFIYENAEVFELNDSNLTVNAQKCSITFSPTTIDETAQVCVRNSLLTPRPSEGVTGGVGIDISMLDEKGNEVHELSGVAKITIPLQVPAGQTVGAAYFNEQTGEWEPVYVEYDSETGTGTILTDHLSCFSLVYFYDENTRQEYFEDVYEMPIIYTFDEGVKKLFTLLGSNQPEVVEALEFKNEMGLWQSLGLDGFYQGAVAVTEPLFDFKPGVIDNAVSIMGELGTALTILDVVRADLQGDNIGVASNTLKVLMAKTVGAAASWIGTPVMAASMSLVAFIGVALEKFGTTMQQRELDYHRVAYRYYYSKEGFEDLGSASKFRSANGKDKPHSYYRTIKDWYDYFYPVFLKKDMTEERLMAYIEQSVRRYCEQFWEEEGEVITESFKKAKEIANSLGMSILPFPKAEIQKQISDEYFAELMSGQLTSVFQNLREKQIVQAHERAASKVKRLGKMMRNKVRFVISDSSVEEGKPSKFAGRKIGFATIPDVSDPEEWVTYIDEEGNAKLGWFTTYALVKNMVPFKITLFDENGQPEKIFNFKLDGVSKETVINIDPGKQGVKADTKHLDNLKLEYTPESVKLITPGYLEFYDPATRRYETSYTDNLFNEDMYADERASLLYDNKVRFCTELERFFNRHDFITADSLTGNFTIGDDIVGKLKGDTASGTFIINTDYKYFVQNPQQWCDKWNNRDINAFYFRTLSGSFKHQIACKYFIRRRKVDDHFEYDVTYTGEGVWDNTMQRITSINVPHYWQYHFELEIRYYYLRLEDIDVGPVSIGGDVKLEYTTTLK